MIEIVIGDVIVRARADVSEDHLQRVIRVKIVWWDGSGVCLYAKRLEKAQFCWPRIGHNRVQLNHAQLLALIDGMDWKRVRSVPVKPPEIVG